MRLAVSAYPIDWHNRWNEYVGKLRLWVRTAAEGGAELVVFPELAALELASLAGAENAADAGRATEALTARIKDVDDLHASLAREFGTHILAASGPIRLAEAGVVDRARLFAPAGGRGAADRVSPEAPPLWGLAPGAEPVVFETALGRIGALIGPDVADAGIAARLAAAGAGILVAACRSETAEAAAVRRAELRARAAETGLPAALAVTIGDTGWTPLAARSTGAAAAFGADGSELAAGKPDAPGWVHLEVEPAVGPAASVAGVAPAQVAQVA